MEKNKGNEKPTYSLLVSNVGWVQRDNPDYEVVKGLYDDYARSTRFSQVTMWSSESHDPIHETYLEKRNVEGDEEDDDGE